MESKTSCPNLPKDILSNLVCNKQGFTKGILKSKERVIAVIAIVLLRSFSRRSLCRFLCLLGCLLGDSASLRRRNGGLRICQLVDDAGSLVVLHLHLQAFSERDVGVLVGVIGNCHRRLLRG